MKILIIGSGGREHALGWKLKQSPRVDEIFFAPGNAGTENIGTNVPIAVSDIDALTTFVAANDISLTVVGSEDPLIAGIVDQFQAAGLRIFGPTAAAAMIEGSKAFAKRRLQEARIATANHRTFSDYTRAFAYMQDDGILPCFVKVSGPALGKGAIPCETMEEAQNALHEIMVDKKFGDAGNTVVIEEWLRGDEYSVHALCAARRALLFPFTRDHKRALENDQGENTGGMGTVAPIPSSHIFRSQIQIGILERILEAMEERGTPYRGLLFPGIMATDEGPKVLEFNCRFGDPETEVLMRLLETDLLDLLEATIDDKLGEIDIKWKPGFAACVILASGGYPGPYEKGKLITGIKDAEEIPGVNVFHCGTKRQNDSFVTNGGRVLAVTCYANTLQGALDGAYAAVERIEFEGMQYRTDIGASLLTPAKSSP